jgi:hypothetical protein
MQRLRTLRCAATLVLLASPACGPTLQLTPSGRDVQLVTAISPDLLDAYRELGVVSCSRGESLMPFGRSLETNIVQCQNELRNKTGGLGGDVVYVTSQQLGHGDCGRCVTMIGTAYRRR